jgi:hypothetical protein
MQLALELLQAGRKECVLEYFALCEKFWELGKAQLRAWSDDIKSGRQPVFGGNLTLALKARFIRHGLAT